MIYQTKKLRQLQILHHSIVYTRLEEGNGGGVGGVGGGGLENCKSTTVQISSLWRIYLFPSGTRINNFISTVGRQIQKGFCHLNDGVVILAAMSFGDFRYRYLKNESNTDIKPSGVT